MSGHSLPMVGQTGFGGRTDIRCTKTSGVPDPKAVPIVGHALAQHLEARDEGRAIRERRGLGRPVVHDRRPRILPDPVPALHSSLRWWRIP